MTITVLAVTGHSTVAVTKLDGNYHFRVTSKETGGTRWPQGHTAVRVNAGFNLKPHTTQTGSFYSLRRPLLTKKAKFRR